MHEQRDHNSEKYCILNDSNKTADLINDDYEYEMNYSQIIVYLTWKGLLLKCSVQDITHHNSTCKVDCAVLKSAYGNKFKLRMYNTPRINHDKNYHQLHGQNQA